MHESPPHRLTMDATQHQMDDFTSLSAGLPDITIVTSGLRSTFLELQLCERLLHREDEMPTSGWQDTSWHTAWTRCTGQPTDREVRIRSDLFPFDAYRWYKSRQFNLYLNTKSYHIYTMVFLRFELKLIQLGMCLNDQLSVRSRTVIEVPVSIAVWRLTVCYWVQPILQHCLIVVLQKNKSCTR